MVTILGHVQPPFRLRTSTRLGIFITIHVSSFCSLFTGSRLKVTIGQFSDR